MMNEELTAITGRRKGEITEIDQVAGVVESSQVCMRMKSTTINRPHNNAGRRKGNNTINDRR
jgi:hypothetical protein